MIKSAIVITLQEGEIPAEEMEVLRRESVRQGRPLDELVKEWLIEKAKQLLAA